ncbi:MAG: hypothetical protein LKKZDAJK_002045 [Candidatus Fervidibacter sp.]
MKSWGLVNLNKALALVVALTDGDRLSDALCLSGAEMLW